MKQLLIGGGWVAPEADAALPSGGVKKSGHGREKGLLALEEMSSTKTILQFHG